jgi:hypothetical protein
MEPKMQKILFTDPDKTRDDDHDFLDALLQETQETSFVFAPKKKPGRARNIFWHNNGTAQIRRGRFGGDRGPTHRDDDQRRQREQEKLENALSGGQKVRKTRLGGVSRGYRCDIDRRRIRDQDELQRALSDLREDLANRQNAATKAQAELYSAQFKAKFKKAKSKRAQAKLQTEESLQNKQSRKSRRRHRHHARRQGTSFNGHKQTSCSRAGTQRPVPMHNALIHFRVERVAIIDGRITAVLAPRQSAQHVN